MKIRESSDRLRAVLERSFPSGVRVVEVEWLGDLEWIVSWRLGTDPRRPGKRSKTIRLTITQEAFEDYAEAPPAQQRVADEWLQKYLAAQLVHFNPDHQTPLGREPPMVHWRISAVDLLG